MSAKNATRWAVMNVLATGRTDGNVPNVLGSFSNDPRTPANGRVGDRLRSWTALGLGVGLLLLAGAAPAAADFAKPTAAAHGKAPGCIVVDWLGTSLSGVHHLEVTRENPPRPPWVINPDQEPYQEDCGLDPDTEYRYQVCAFYITEDGDSECSEWIVGRTQKPQQPHAPQPPPTPRIVTHDVADTWIGIRWEAGHDYDSYFVNTSENIAAGLPRNTRTIHHDDDGNWGYQRVDGLRPGHTYYFEVQGCTNSWFGILEDNCWGWSEVYPASTAPPPDPRTCVSGYVWREVTSDDLVCVSPDERDVQIPNDEEQHAARARRRFDPSSCPLNNPKSRKCYVTECIPPFLFRAATPGDKVCVTPERAQQVAADNAAASSRQVGVRARWRETAARLPETAGWRPTAALANREWCSG